mgnify:CR=1 FL=1
MSTSWVPMRFTVKRRAGRFLDSSVAEALARLTAAGQIKGEAPVRVMLVDRRGQAWGAPRPIFLVQGTVSDFASGVTLGNASQRWMARLREFGIEPKMTGDFTRCVVEVARRAA